MAIEATFGSRMNRFNNAAATSTAETTTEKRPQAEYWLNIGHRTNDPKYPFVALPVGIPLSLDDRKDIRGSSEYANLLSAQNDLLEDLVEMAMKLEPGDDHIFDHPEMPLAFQVRRVRGEQAPINPSANPLSRRGQLFTAEAAE